MRSRTSPSACLVAAFSVLSVMAMPSATKAATAEQARAFSERAAAHIEEVGAEKAFADFTRPDGGFIDHELYVFCYDRVGVNKAHGGNPALVGRNLMHIKDPDGAEPNVMIRLPTGPRLGEFQMAEPRNQEN